MRSVSDRVSSRVLRSSNDRWLFGYADVVTLLFACFAALYSGVAAPPREAVDNQSLRGVRDRVPPPPLHRDLKEVADAAEPLMIDVTIEAAGTVISVPEAGSFAPGRAELTPAAERAMRALADVLRRHDVQIRVEGHTDDRPIRTRLYASNWELSTARATRVVQYLVDTCGIEPARLSAAGHAHYRPRASNETPAGRARNRRVDLVVMGAGERGQAEPPQADYTGVGRGASGQR